MWEDWATIPCFKIVTLLLARKGQHIFSSRKIGEWLDIPKSTVIFNLRLLLDNGYIVKNGDDYFLNTSFQTDQPIGQVTNPLVDTDQPIGHTATNPLVNNNDKEIIIKNDSKSAVQFSEKQLIGSAPESEKDKLPSPLQEFFKSRGKIECSLNVWITEKEYSRLTQKWGAERVEKAISEMSEWSVSLDISSKTNLPGWKSYRQKRDHAKTIDNNLSRKFKEAA